MIEQYLDKERTGFGCQSLASSAVYRFGDSVLRRAYNKAVKPLASSLGHSAFRACSGMASPFLPEHSLHAERRLPWRYVLSTIQPRAVNR